MYRIAWIACCLALLAAAPIAPAMAQAQIPTSQPRDAQAIETDLDAAFANFQKAVHGGRAFWTADARKNSATVVTAAADRIISLFQEMATVRPEMKDDIATDLAQFGTVKLIYGEASQTAAVDKAAAGTGPEAAVAQAQRAMAHFLTAEQDADRDKALDEYEAAVKAAPDNATVQSLAGLLALSAPPSQEVIDRLGKLAADTQSAGLQQIVQQLQAEAKLRTLENKPFTIESVKLDGTKFSTADWKGKVILVDFWATWCAPCMAEMPRVKAIYKRYHDQGLEIVGVSCDNSADDLKQYLAATPDVAWPQLFDATKPGWNAVATTYGVLSIPHMFLVDRKGILRSVNGREVMEEMVPNLLGEKGE